MQKNYKCFWSSALTYLLLPLRWKLSCQDYRQIFPGMVLCISPIPCNTFGQIEQLWMRTLSLLWFELVLWLLLSNLKGYSGKVCEWTVSFPRLELLHNPRNIICCVGVRTDFSGWTVNLSSRKSATVAQIFLKQISMVSPSNSESSIYFTDK